MPVTAEQAGTYKQIAHRLRIHDAQGVSVNHERPRTGTKGDWGAYLDSDEEPTLITLNAGDQVDVPALLSAGGIQPYTNPRARKGVGNGKNSGGE